jgi:sec-independent protein translocase protein TatB
MFDILDPWKIAVLALLAVFLFGPEQLPKLVGDAVRILRTVRMMARTATTDLNRELGTDIQFDDLHPRTLIRKHLLSETEEQALRASLDDVLHEIRGPLDDAYREINKSAREVGDTATPVPREDVDEQSRPLGEHTTPQRPEPPSPHRYDADAT